MEGIEKTDYSGIATVFFQDGYNLARQKTARGTGRKAILQIMQVAYESIDGLLDSFRRRCDRENLKVDCRKGCSWCCHQAVLASPHEILCISDYLENNVEEPTRERIRERAAGKHSVTREMNAMEFLHYLHPCPFLEKGCCLIYPVRPVACRCYLSSSFNSCREQVDNPEDRTKIAALYDFPLKAGRGMNEGIRSALMERGLIPSEWLLESFIAAIFEHEKILDAWLGGEAPFGIRKLSAEENRYLREYNGKQGSQETEN